MLFTDGDGREKFCHQRRYEVSKNASVMDPIKTASILGLADGDSGSSLKITMQKFWHPAVLQTTCS